MLMTKEQLTTDRAYVERLIRQYAGEVDHLAQEALECVGHPGTYTVVSDEIVLIIVPLDKFGTYGFWHTAEKNARGSRAAAAVNRVFSWLFINTNAIMIRTSIDAANKPSVQGARWLWGATVRRPTPDADHYVFKQTIANWAKVYGIEKAISEMRAAGQAAKADKLEAAAMKARLLNG